MIVKHDIMWIEVVVRTAKGVEMLNSAPKCGYVVVSGCSAALRRVLLAQVAGIDFFHQGVTICFETETNHSSIVGNFTAVVGGQVLVWMLLEHFACLYILKCVLDRPNYRIIC